MLTLGRIDNDDKLREKVDEALTVYDEYVKTAGEGTGAQDPDGKADDSAPLAEAEGVNA
jgi:polyadenylate-binding protein